jgi:26S proteasome regulatory subunit N1
MSHNGEPEACDLLLEVEQLDKILDYVDASNYNRVCLYLLSNANYAPEPEDKEILRIVLRIYQKVNKLTDALVVAMKLNDLTEINAIYSSASEYVSLSLSVSLLNYCWLCVADTRSVFLICSAVKKQLALMLGRQHVFNVDESEPELLDLIGNTRSSKYFLMLAKDLDVLEPKLPDDIYKTHLLDARYGVLPA